MYSNPTKPKVYFAHPMAVYDTQLEVRCMEAIAKKFPNHEVVNPNGLCHQKVCRMTSMEYFKFLVDYCDVLVAMPYSDGAFGAGVYYEMQMAMHHRKDVYRFSEIKMSKQGQWSPGKLIKDDGLFFSIRPLSITETSRRNKAKQI